MGTQSPKLVYYTRECRDKSPQSCCRGRTKKEPEVEIPMHIHKQKMPEPKKELIPLNKPSSMSGLIVWNVSKALKMKPCLDLKSSIKDAEQRLKSDERDLSAVSDKHPEQQHLLCALLAWQQMGHHHADSLYKFVKPRINEKCGAAKCESKPNTSCKDLTSIHGANNTKNVGRNPVWKNLKPSDNGSFGSHTSGPIVALPVEPKFIMRVDKDGCCGQNPPKGRKSSRADKDLVCCDRKAKHRDDNDISCCGQGKADSKPHIDNDQSCCAQNPAKSKPRCAAKMPTSSEQDVTRPEQETHDKTDKPNKPDGVCCLDKQCAETLAALDAKTNELRTRAFQLAQHEGTRVQLLERAEVAWTDLEQGYQKQLEEEKDKGRNMEKQAKTMIVERNFCKIDCKSLAEDLKYKKDGAEQAKHKLTALENEVIELAATKLHLDEEAAKGEAALAEELARVLQYERDLKFNEDQASRKFDSLMNEADSARALACELERSMRAELSALRDQIETISKQLLTEDEEAAKTKIEHDQLRSDKKDLIEDLEACKASCDKKMQWLLEDLKDRKKKLLDLQELVLECRCKVPSDATVQVKRTASLAALCRCAPEDNLLESCSCTSLRSRLLNDLLADLFSGLQAELGLTGWQMPCQMLKCLEDQHSWEKPSVLKTNLRNFFSQLLKGELDIAIATSIEHYHARWVGASCADAKKMEPTLDDDLKEGWQERAIERRAQQLANKLVENLYKERAEQMKQPCDCDPKPSTDCKIFGQSKNVSQPQQAALFPCLLPPTSPFNRAATTPAVYQQAIDTPPPYWKKTFQDVTQLKLQIEDLQKDSIKKEDLKVMEENISKIVREASVMEKEDSLATSRDNSNIQEESVKKEIKNSRVGNSDESPKTSNQNKLGTARKKDGLLKKATINEKPTKQSRKTVHGQLYAVNLCLGGPQKNINSLHNAQRNDNEKSTWKQNSLKSIQPQSSAVKQIKPININLLSPELQENNCKTSELCDSNCKCFHKTPSSASIDRLLQTLVTWKYELAPQEKCVKNDKISSSKCSKTAIKQTSSKLNQNDSTSTTSNYKKQVYDSDINNDKHSKADEQNRSFMKQPITTESEYMGTVYLDKSHENSCKCVANIEYNQEHNCENYNGGEHIPFQCINTHTCDCKIYKKMQKDHKRSQTLALNLQNQSINCQDAQSKDYPECDEFQHNPKTSSNINYQKELKQKSNMNNVPLKTELYSNSSEYFIKFLGVTLDDLSSDKIKKIKIKPVDHHEPPRKFSENLSNMDKSNSLIKPFFLTKEQTNQSGFNDCTKCECEAKFKEFSSLMTNILDKKLHENSHKVEVIDPQNVKCAVDNTIESCVCCTGVNGGDSRDLEVNAFHLLEEHIKEKIKEFKRFSCIPPEEEEKLFSTILQRVKQVISDSANKIKCGCPGVLPNNGSWNRAYGLLQEYLKIKIKRVQCLCVMNDRKDVILPEVLDKVCNLIESDFKRLKDIYCTCENNTDTRTNIARIGDLVLPPPTELPEKDTNTSQTNYSDREIKKCSDNLNNSMIIKENISSQVSPYLGKKAISCDIMEPSSNTNARTTETDQIITDSKSNGVMYNTCDYSDNTDKVDIMNFPDMFGTKEVLVNLYTEQAINTSDIYDYSLESTAQETSRCLLAGGVESTKPISKIENNKNDEKNVITQKQLVNIQTPNPPYIGYTVDCSCDDALGSCFCMKSVVQSNNDKIDNIWKGFLVNDSKQFSYIMHGNPNQNNSDIDVNCHSIPNVSVIDQTSTTAVLNDDILTCEAEILAENVDDLILKCSLEHVDLANHAANTVDVESSSLETAYSNNDFYSIDWIKSPLPAVSGRSHAIKLTNSIYFPGIPIDNDQNSFISGITADFDTQKTSDSCVCDKVPICHVKMLVEHIEKNLVESKCTCDSLISKVCPVHSKRDF